VTKKSTLLLFIFSHLNFDASKSGNWQWLFNIQTKRSANINSKPKKPKISQIMADNDCSDNDDNPNVPPTKPRFGKTQKGKLMLIDHQWYCYTQDGAKGSRAF